jgi:hypothetical protein
MMAQAQIQHYQQMQTMQPN